MTIDKLPEGKFYPRDWKSFVSTALLNLVNVKPEFEVMVVQPSYLFRGLPAILSQFHPRIVFNYFIFKVIDRALNHLHSEARKVEENYAALLKVSLLHAEV